MISKKICLTFFAILIALMMNLGLFGLFLVDAQSFVSTVVVDPENPTEMDDITLTVYGWLPDSCWSYVSGDYSISNNQIDINLYTHDCWVPGTACLCIVIPYSEEFNISQLENGKYLINVTEFRDSLSNPSPEYYFSEFTVSPVQPCKCDMNDDGKCDMEDWLIFGEDWGRTDCNDPGVEPCGCDLNHDGRCDMQDWLLFGEDWGRTDCPVYPRIEEYSNSGCLPGSAIDSPGDQYPWCGSDEIDVFVEGHGIHVTHRNATYNCCPDDIKVSLSVEGNLLRLSEEEILTHPCFCLCCYDVKASIVGLLPGVYTLEYCWDDYETGAECYIDEIVIP